MATSTRSRASAAAGVASRRGARAILNFSKWRFGVYTGVANELRRSGLAVPVKIVPSKKGAPVWACVAFVCVSALGGGWGAVSSVGSGPDAKAAFFF